MVLIGRRYGLKIESPIFPTICPFLSSSKIILVLMFETYFYLFPFIISLYYFSLYLFWLNCLEILSLISYEILIEYYQHTCLYVNNDNLIKTFKSVYKLNVFFLSCSITIQSQLFCNEFIRIFKSSGFFIYFSLFNIFESHKIN